MSNSGEVVETTEYVLVTVEASREALAGREMRMASSGERMEMGVGGARFVGRRDGGTAVVGRGETTAATAPLALDWSRWLATHGREKEAEEQTREEAGERQKKKGEET